LEEVFFILTSEISCIYSKKGKVRKIHILIFAPNFETVEKINTRLNLIGNLKSDGRPILGLDVKELAKIVLNISPDCLIVPAHCLLPDTFLHCNPGLKMIKDIYSFCNWTASHVDIGDDHVLTTLIEKKNSFLEIVK